MGESGLNQPQDHSCIHSLFGFPLLPMSSQPLQVPAFLGNDDERQQQQDTCRNNSLTTLAQLPIDGFVGVMEDEHSTVSVPKDIHFSALYKARLDDERSSCCFLNMSSRIDTLEVAVHALQESHAELKTQLQELKDDFQRQFKGL